MQKNAFEKVVRKMAAILSWPQCVKLSLRNAIEITNTMSMETESIMGQNELPFEMW